jgi:uncharacterized protein YbjQ (UPF0145 family)
MGVQLPQKNLSNDEIKRRQLVDNSQAIIGVRGNNPYAKAIDQLAPIIANALIQRQQMKEQARQAALVRESIQKGEVSEGIGDPSTILDTYKAISSIKIPSTEGQAVAFVDTKTKEMFDSSGNRLDSLDPNFKWTFRNLDNTDPIRSNNLKLRETGLVLQHMRSMRSDPEIKSLYQMKINSGTVDELINKIKEGNTVASAALGMKMAKAMGEVGVLTDADVIRYVQSGRLDRKTADQLSRMMQGKPTDATLAEISQISNVLRDTFDSRVQPVYDTYIDSLSENLNISREDAFKRLGFTTNSLKSKSNQGNKSTKADDASTLLDEWKKSRGK